MSRTPSIRADAGCQRCEEYEAECAAMDDRITELEVENSKMKELLDDITTEAVATDFNIGRIRRLCYSGRNQ